jgi:hypothetical protein
MIKENYLIPECSMQIYKETKIPTFETPNIQLDTAPEYTVKQNKVYNSIKGG